MQIFDTKEFLKRTENIDFESSELYQILNQIILSFGPFDGDIGTLPYIAGGAVRRLISKKPLDSDIDFFFEDETEFNLFNTICCEFSGAKKLSENDTNVTYLIPFEIFEDPASPDKKRIKEVKIQLIRIAYYDSFEKLFDTFDFTICQCGLEICYKKSDKGIFYIDSSDLYFSDYFLLDFTKNRLVVNKITYPVASLRRIIKYTKQGFYACNGCLESYLKSVVESDKQNPNGFNKSKYID